ncbi:MAG: DEAD/DEAH box helicase [Flavipsychrobacter sp.]
MATFSDFPLREELVSAVTEMGFETPTPIQEKVIPHLTSQPSDIIGLAQTGTGKTAAFGLPLLHHTDPAQQHVQALVLSPTRELCMQIQEEFIKYSSHMRGLRTVAVYGGVPISGQIRDVKRGPQVIVATPGRLIDLIERKVLHLEQVKYMVLDEADEMLNMGFREDIEFILQNTTEREHTWLFSATMSNDVRRIAKRFMRDPQEFAVAKENTTNENIDHQYYVTQHHNRFNTLQRLLDFTPGIYGVIFTRTKQDAHDVSERLMRMGYHVSALHGDMDQKMRSKVMERFKNRTLQAIVATDVAARGIDVSDITHVINYELPDDPEVYTHRSGRTARAGKSGICMSITSPKEISRIRQIERMIKTKFNKSDIPDGAEVVRKRLFYCLEQIEAAEPKDDFASIYQSSIHERFEDMDKDELIRRLLWMQLKETIDAYHNAQDLNASAGKERSGGRERGDSVRLFMNMGEKDGIKSPQDLLQFVTEASDVESNIIQRITIRELSSFFNVPSDAADFIMAALSQKKHKGRKVRIEEAEQRDRDRFRGGKGAEGGGKSKSGGRTRSFGNRDGGRKYAQSSDNKRDSGRQRTRKRTNR